MKTFLALLTMVVVTSVALAQDPGAISGQVVDAATNSPVPGAVVICHGDSGAAGRAQTNERGAYRIPGLAPGSYRLMAQARGYEPARFPEPVGVRSGRVTENINFRLRPLAPQAGAIAGRVTDARTGEPIRGAVVMAVSRQFAARARTDARGNYVIRALPAGTYGVKAAARGYAKEAFPRPVPVEAGQVTEDIDFALRPRPRKGAITGRVLDARTHEPIAGAQVVAVGVYGRGQARTDRRGCYRLKLVPGTYQVTARARGYEPQVFPRRVPVHPHQVTTDVNFGLRRMHSDFD
jgi:protocatechuate 3,4-dioxygenase beta subunit